MRRVLALALLTGALAGGVAAVAIPRETGPSSRPLRFAPERGAGPASMATLRPEPGSVRIDLRRDDPGGGPDWALRTFTAEMVPPRGVPPESIGSDLKGRRFCAQLGRIARGRFGWVDGASTFRPVGKRFDEAPITCENAERRPGPPTMLEVITPVADLDRQEARLTRTVVWGLAGPMAERVDLRTGGRVMRPELSAQGGFIEFRPPSVTRRDVRATFHHPGRPPHTVLGDQFVRALRPPGGKRRDTPRPHGPAVQARAPDPNGGLPYGLGAVRGRRGGWCLTQPGRIVGGRVGQIHFALGAFYDDFADTGRCTSDSPLNRRRPVDTAYVLGGAGPASNPQSDPAPGRIARRTLPGITAVHGSAHPDVVAITIATPRDVRTITPSGRAHAFIAVYDGEFPTGEFVVTAHFKDGSSRVADRFPAMGGI